jgi:hypothetical protein
MMKILPVSSVRCERIDGAVTRAGGVLFEGKESMTGEEELLRC